MLTKSLIVEGSSSNITTNQLSNLSNTTTQVSPQSIQSNVTLSNVTCDKSSIQLPDPVEMDSITWLISTDPAEDLQPTSVPPVNMKTLHTEKEIFDCRTDTGAHKVDVVLLTEVFGDSVNPGFKSDETRFKVLECLRSSDGEPLGCTVYSVPESVSDLNRCIEQQIAFPIESNTEILDVTKRIVTAEKHVYNCQATDAIPPDRIKEVTIFTSLLGIDNNRTTELATLATVCIKDISKAKVESCRTINLL